MDSFQQRKTNWDVSRSGPWSPKKRVISDDRPHLAAKTSSVCSNWSRYRRQTGKQDWKTDKSNQIIKTISDNKKCYGNKEPG